MLHRAEGHPLTGLHTAVGIAVLVANAVAAGWGVAGWLRGNARASLVTAQRPLSVAPEAVRLALDRSQSVKVVLTA